MGGAVSFEQWMAWYGSSYAAALWFFGIVLAAVFLFFVGTERIPRTSCPSCGYDLEGLPVDTLCPECGGKGGRPQFTVLWRRYRIRQDRDRAVAVAIVASAIAFLAPLLLTEPVVSFSCWMQFGDRWSGAIPRYSWLVFVPVAALGPFVPLLALLPGKRGARAMIGVVSIAILGVVGWQTLGYWLWMRGWVGGL